MTRLLLLLALLAPSARPTSKFVYSCDPAPLLRCSFTSVSVGKPVKLVWNWGDGRTETHTDSIARNTWAAPGTYTVRLTVTDSIGGSSYSTQKITLPPSQLVRVDTVTITKHDTIAMLVALPTPLPTMSGIYVDSAMVGQPIRFYRVCLMGMGQGRVGGAVELFPNTGWTPPANQVTVGFFASAGVARTLSGAAAQLDTTIAGCKP